MWLWGGWVGGKYKPRVGREMGGESGAKDLGWPRITRKVIEFQLSLLQGNTSHKNWSQGHSKSWNMYPVIMRTPTSSKIDFCNIPYAECSGFQCHISPSLGPKISKEISTGLVYGFGLPPRHVPQEPWTKRVNQTGLIHGFGLRVNQTGLVYGDSTID